MIVSFKTALFALALTAFFSLSTNAQTDFFWSPHDLNSGAVNGAANVEYRPGDTGSLFLYYTTNGPIDSDIDTGGFLDVATMTTGVVQFTVAESLDFAIVASSGAPVDNRYLEDNGGGGALGVNALSDDMIDGWHAFTIAGGSGILEANTGMPFFDTGYDAEADAFLWGRIDFLVVGNPGDSTDLITERDEIGIVNQAQQLFPTFGNVTITVVPEPASSCLVAMCLLGFIAQRRRQ